MNPLQPSVEAVSAVRGAVRAALAIESGAPASWDWPGTDTDDFVAAVHRHRVTQVLATHGSEIGLPTDLARTLATEHDGTRMAGIMLFRELGQAAVALDGAGVPFLAFKGQALAVQSTGDPFARGHGDLDLLVAPELAAQAAVAIESAGWAPVDDYPRDPESWAWRHQLATSWEMTYVGAGGSIDLHWRLAPTHWALPDFHTAWSRRAAVTVGPNTVQTLGLADAFAHTVSHASKDDWRWLRSLVDVHRLARHLEPDDLAHLRPVDLMTLAVTDATIGLPPQLPAALVGLVRVRSARSVRTAVAAQDVPVPDATAARHGSGLAQAVAGALRGNRSPGEFLRVLYGVLLPGRHLGGFNDRSALTGVPRAFLQRARTALRKVWAAVAGRGQP